MAVDLDAFVAWGSLLSLVHSFIVTLYIMIVGCFAGSACGVHGLRFFSFGT